MTKEKCGCIVTVNQKTQFETVKPCEKHDSWKRFTKALGILKKTWTKGIGQI